MNSILGLHHITAIASEAQKNYDFYTRVLGLRLVKKTVNFDDPGTYHFYFGNETGSPGTILTFFPWTYVKRGMVGTGMATDISYDTTPESLEFWKQRLAAFSVKTEEKEIFGERSLLFHDPDGLNLQIIASHDKDERKPWLTNGIDEKDALKGFYSVTLTLKDISATAGVLTDIFGYRLSKSENGLSRYVIDTVNEARYVDLLEKPNGAPGIVAGGTNHHVAFRVRDEETLMHFRNKVLEHGLHITEKIDRNYFYSLYFREPGGVLFEIATDNPGFMADESVGELGKNLKLPAQYESRRRIIEGQLPTLIQA